MNLNSTYGFIGGGRITYILLTALNSKNVLPSKVIVSDPNEEAREKVINISSDIIECVNENRQAAQADVVFLSVHPPVIKEVLAEIKNDINKTSLGHRRSRLRGRCLDTQIS